MFCKIFSLNVSSKFEPYNLQHCKKNCRKLDFCVFLEQLLPFIFLWVATLLLQKSLINHYLQKSETNIFKQKRFLKKLVQSQQEKNSGILILNKIMSKLLTISKCLQLNCWQIQQLLAIVTLFWTCRAFSHFTYHLRYYIIIIIDHSWNLPTF